MTAETLEEVEETVTARHGYPIVTTTLPRSLRPASIAEISGIACASGTVSAIGRTSVLSWAAFARRSSRSARGFPTIGFIRRSNTARKNRTGVGSTVVKVPPLRSRPIPVDVESVPAASNTTSNTSEIVDAALTR